MSVLLPHLGAALAVSIAALAIGRRFTDQILPLTGIFVATLVLVLVPFAGDPATHYLRVLTGDVSITALTWFSVVAALVIYSGQRTVRDEEIHMAMVIVVIALVFYPSSLGVSPWDLYQAGFQPILLAPIAFILFAISVWFRAWVPATAIALAIPAYHFRILESDNLWDYLFDPTITVYSITLLVGYFRQRLIT